MIRNLSDAEIAQLLACANMEEYRVVARAIKTATDGAYTEDWFERVLGPGGIHEQLARKWGNPDAFEVQSWSSTSGRVQDLKVEVKSKWN
jgi:hypothetical protein